MRSVSCLMFVSLLVFGAGRQASGAPPKPVENSPLAQADNQFAVDLYGRLDREQPGKNLFFSPTSISMALAMVAAGARGQTEAEMAKVLHLGASLPQAHAEYNRLLARWNAEGTKREYQLRVANRLWGQKGYPFLAEYLTLTRQQYGAELAIVDFVAQTEAARVQINTWVEKQTEEKITDLIPRGAIDDMTRLVLTNAIYFKGNWVKQFNKDSTHDGPFTVAAGKKVQVPLMFQEASYGYAEDQAGQALELPYKGGDLSMVVLLPRKADGLGDLESSLSAHTPGIVRYKLRNKKVMVFLPRFKLETTFTLNDTLRALGMKLAFEPDQADFSGMDGRKDLYVSKALHKAFVDVNETGTEAAAATGIVVGVYSAPLEPPPVFRADHPFLFMIVDKRDGSILFLGRLIDPQAAGK